MAGAVLCLYFDWPVVGGRLGMVTAGTPVSLLRVLPVLCTQFLAEHTMCILLQLAC